MVTGMGSFIMSFGIWANDESEMPNRSSKGINLRMVFLFFIERAIAGFSIALQKYVFLQRNLLRNVGKQI